MKKEVKLLLLGIHSLLHLDVKKKITDFFKNSTGAGESGKSTVLKQMRLIHASGFKPSEREGFRVIVFLNVFQTMQTLIEAAQSFDLIDPSLEVSLIFLKCQRKKKRKTKVIYYFKKRNIQNSLLNHLLSMNVNVFLKTSTFH
jgi:hypothetical protein